MTQPAFKAFDPLGTAAPSTAAGPSVVLPFVQPSTGVTGEVVHAISTPRSSIRCA
jgi:hypothetical protein